MSDLRPLALLASLVCAFAAEADKWRQAHPIGDQWFGMPERPTSKSPSWGEAHVQRAPTMKMREENPWWGAVAQWKLRGGRGRIVKQKMLFIGGLPRSGTTLLEVFFRAHMQISSLQFGKHDHMHEGLELMSESDGNMMSKFFAYGGSRKRYSKMCGIDKWGDIDGNAPMQLTNIVPIEEEDDGQVDEFRRQSWKAWQTWNFSRPVLAVKDPPNLLRMSFLQKAFQETHDVFAIFTMMHPLEIASKYSCSPRSEQRNTIGRNWLNCHNQWLQDLTQIRNYLVIPFEAWFLHPQATGRAIENFLFLRTHVEVELPRRLSQKKTGLRGGGKHSRSGNLSSIAWRSFRSVQPKRKDRRLIYHGNKFLLSRKYFGHCRKTEPKQSFDKFRLQELAKEFDRFGYNISDSQHLHKPLAFELCMLGGVPCRNLY